MGILLTLVAILVMGGAFRFYNVNWDKGTYHIHPDERHTTMVITAIQWPESPSEYFDTSHSPLNPRNANTVFFYGTLPLFLTKLVATELDALITSYTDARPELAADTAARPRLTGYDQIHLVGRVLSAIFDLGSVLLLFFLARRLFDWRVGLVASFLLALTALNIQGSHYFAVDTFLTFFVMLTIWFTLDVAERKRWTSYVNLGISMGLTLACKVSVFLLAVVVALGAWTWVRRRVGEGHDPGKTTVRAIGGLILAALVAITVFRVAQPYAWAGPDYDGWESVPDPWGERLKVFEKVPEPIRSVLMPNPRWIADIVEAGAQQTGEADLPWGRQWTGRAPWLYPFENMVLWGMGVPLGVAAWLGVVLILFQLVRGWRRRSARSGDRGPLGIAHWDLVVIPLAWVLLTFLWQGMQFVKSIRYFLPIYPFLAAFAAYLVVSAWQWGRGHHWGAKVLAGGLAGIVLLGTLAWAFAFIQIYTEPVTRVQATRWMYENVETGATLHYYTADGETGQLQIPLPSTHVFAMDGQWLTTPFTPPQDMSATEVVMNNLTGLEGLSEGIFAVQITSQAQEDQPLAETQIVATFGGDGGQRYVLDIPDAPLRGGQTYFLQSRALRGAPLVSYGAAIANEHFDDGLPFNMDGRISFGSGPYRGLDLTLYDEDTPEKLDKLLDVLDEADYISMSSGRLWQSIPRLPMRYPVTTRYYDLLFAQELGFDRAAEFHSYPRLFGVEFDDTWAEEQFTVYDHPKVLIFRKTDEYDRERVRALLSEGIDWEGIAHWLNPRDVSDWQRSHEQQNNLMLTEAQRQVQERGGTWASIFKQNSLPNRWPTFSWLVLLALLGLAALPLTVAILQWLPDRGYVLARLIGVLLLAWLSWILTNLTPLHYSRGTILLALGLIALASLATLLLPGQRRRLADLWRRQRRLVLTSEVLFLAFFALFWFIRWGNPDLWHPWKGGEKPMDLAYLTAVIKSTEFPPYDPWFAGGYLNYYYFGQVLVGTLIKLIGIVPSVAYNLVIPTWFAMTAMGAFSVTYNLVLRRADGKRRRALAFALVGALLVCVLGNLGEIHLILLKLGEGMLDTFQSTVPGLASLVRTVIGAFELIFGGRALPISIDEWYWNASRAIPAGPGEAVITEFPFFTFLYADLHPNLIAQPLTFLSLSIALALVKGASGPQARGWRERLVVLATLFVWGLTIGALRTTNTWDVPPQLLVGLGALTIAEFSRRGRVSWRLVGTVAWQFCLLFLLSWSVLYRPFWASYGSFYDSILVWKGTRTPLWSYLVVHGLFLFCIVSYLVARAAGRGSASSIPSEAKRLTIGEAEQRPDPFLRRLWLTLRYRSRRRRLREVSGIVGVRYLPVSTLVWIGLGALILLEIFFAVPGLTPFTKANAEAAGAGAYAYRGLAVFSLGLPIAVLGLLLFLRPGLSPTERLWAYLVLLGLAITLGVEVIVVEGDIGRMNTVFKFYLQVWLMWGVAAATALAWLMPRLRRSSGRTWWSIILVALLFFASLYPPLAALAKIRDRFEPGMGPGLDGRAYMETADYYDPSGVEYDLKWDLEAIQWMLDNIVGSPVILEGHTPEYRWGARYSINTGLPTVLGWNWHQRQQRAAASDQEVWVRANDVTQIYSTPVAETAESLLGKYHVRYLIVGPLERANYDSRGLDKFERMASEGRLQVAYSNEQVTIYEVTGR
jgi:YYY domain-containing protein